MGEYELKMISSNGEECIIGTFCSEEELEQWAKENKGVLKDSTN